MTTIFALLAALFGLMLMVSIVSIIVPLKNLQFESRKDAAQKAVGSFVLLVTMLTLLAIFVETPKPTDIAVTPAEPKQVPAKAPTKTVEVSQSTLPEWRNQALKRISADNRSIREALWSQRRSFWVSRDDDGTRHDGFAEYLCLELKGLGKPIDESVIITIWSHQDMIRGDFKELGKMRCK